MKRFFTLMLFAFAALLSQGEILYWQVTSSDLAGITDEGPYNATLYVTWVDNNGVEQFRGIESTYVGAYDPDTGEFGSETSEAVPVLDGLSYSADISDYTGTQYSFFVEIVNSDTGHWLGYTDRKSYTELADTGATTGADLSDPGSATVWHDTPGNVPEPTSGLLMLLGAACLGLRRKARSAA